jgi:hypothetical protein
MAEPRRRNIKAVSAVFVVLILVAGSGQALDEFCNGKTIVQWMREFDKAETPGSKVDNWEHVVCKLSEEEPGEMARIMA